MQRRAFEIPEPDGVEEIEPESAMARLDQLAAPTLVLCGELDLPEKIELSRRLGRELPNARFQSIPGAAHMLGMEQPGVFNRLVLDFLAGG